jgi:hypothetical protein
MLVAKEKRPDGKRYKCVYDRPRTPYQRLLEENVLPEKDKAVLARRRKKLVGVELLYRIKKKLKRVKRLQEEYNTAKRRHDIGVLGGGGPGSALRAAPSGTPAAPRPPSARHRPTIRCLRQSLWLKPALPANPLTTNYQFCRIPSLTTRGTLSVSHFRGRVHLAISPPPYPLG